MTLPPRVGTSGLWEELNRTQLNENPGPENLDSLSTSGNWKTNKTGHCECQTVKIEMSPDNI